MPEEFKETRVIFFYEAIQHGSIRAAADILNVAPSAVSRQIMLLEEELSIPLIERHTKGVKPTAAGIYLLAYFREKRSHQHDLLSHLQQLRGLRSGKIHIAIGEGLLPTVINEVLSRFCKKHQDISIVLDTGGTDEIVRSVIEDEVDIGAVFNPPLDPKIVSLISYKSPVHAIVYPDFPLLEKAESFTLRDFLSWPIALNHPSYGVRQILLLAEKAEKIRMNPILTSNSFFALRQFVKQRLGITFLPLAVVADDLAAGEVFSIPIRNDLLGNVETHIIKRTGRQLSFATQSLLQHMIPDMDVSRKKPISSRPSNVIACFGGLST